MKFKIAMRRLASCQSLRSARISTGFNGIFGHHQKFPINFYGKLYRRRADAPSPLGTKLHFYLNHKRPDTQKLALNISKYTTYMLLNRALLYYQL